MSPPKVFAQRKKLWFSFKDLDGKWKNKNTGFEVGREAEATRFAATFVREIERRRKAGEDGMTVAAYFDRWIARRRELGVASVGDEATRILGQPIIGGFHGPMRDGEGVVRYEDTDAYYLLSA